jgi:glyoxylase-like metal-dependent hydrolase (beta-lactamase superfamily II)
MTPRVGRRCLAALALVAPLLGRPAAAAPTARAPLVFATCVENAAQARKAELLLSSIRRFGGPLAAAPVYVVVDGRFPALAARAGELSAIVLPLRVEGPVPPVPFARKAFAAAQVEALVTQSAGTLVWLDPETMVLDPPVALRLGRREAAATRPVFLHNAVGVLPAASVDPFWARLLREAGAAAAAVPAVTTFVDGESIRFYVNCGVFAVRPARGICREWARVFGAVGNDAAFLRSAAADRLHRTFLHQAVFSAVLLARTTAAERRTLGDAVGYPLHLHERVPADRRLARLADAPVVVHEDLLERRPDWSGLLSIDAERAAWLDEALDRFHRVAEGLYREEGSCNTYLVRTATGSVVVDPAGAARPGGFLVRRAGDWPVEAVLTTHGHDDHRRGVGAFRGERDLPVVAQEAVVDELAYRGRLAGFFAARDAAQAGRAAAPASGPAPLEANVLFGEEWSGTFGGVRFEMRHVGGETPDTSLLFVPSLSAAFLADDFYDSFPMLAPPRGSRPRPALDYVKALDLALAREPELLLPGHGEPVVGKAEVRRRLTEYRAALLHVHDAVVMGMNEGKDVETLVREVVLPPGSTVGEFYGRVSWAVRGIWAGYAGWWDGDPARLVGPASRDAEVALVRLAGPGKVVEEARRRLERGDATTALRLADALLAAEASSEDGLALRRAALEALLGASRNFAERNLLDAELKKASGAGPAR